MKILKIESDGKNNIGKFINPSDAGLKNSNYKLIETISEKDIFDIIDYMLENEVDFDACDETNQLPNPIQKTIYVNLHRNFREIYEKKNKIIETIDKEFKTLETQFPSAKDSDGSSK